MACNSCTREKKVSQHFFYITNDGDGIIDDGDGNHSCPDCREEEDNTVYEPPPIYRDYDEDNYDDPSDYGLDEW